MESINSALSWQLTHDANKQTLCWILLNKQVIWHVKTQQRERKTSAFSCEFVYIYLSKQNTGNSICDLPCTLINQVNPSFIAIIQL